MRTKFKISNCLSFVDANPVMYLYLKASKDEQWKRAMDYLNIVSELNYMTQIVIMLYEDPNKVIK